ncbi:MAG: ABC transporter permease [Bacteroidetes bacterium]|nr:ABC transporter permease [Bacteroidota bacterium]
MIKNYVKIILRNLLKRKAFTLINLFGLATGMAVCLLLVLYIQNELGYDDFQERGDQIYRVALERKYPGRSAFLGKIPRSIGPAIKKEFPEVLENTHVLQYSNDDKTKVTVGEKQFLEKEVLMADSNFFRVFTGKFLQGDGNTALQKPGTVVLTASTAKKYFGTVSDAMGKELKMEFGQKYIVSGVCEDWPEKSHFGFTILATTSGENNMNNPEYIYFGPYDYVLLNKNASASALEAKLPQIVDKYVAGIVARSFGEPYDKFVAEGNGYRYFLQPIKKIHLTSALEQELRPTVSMQTIILFGAIAAFILFLACVNFINLSTALSIERAREIGIRKTFGSRKRQLIGQFLLESILFGITSLLIALFLVYLLVPALNKIAGMELSFSYFLTPLSILSLLFFSIFIGIVAGIYPAFMLSSFDPIIVLKGRFKSNNRGIALRNGLVVFQFSISVILIICTIVVNNQMQYVLGDQLGFKKDHIISIDKAWKVSAENHGDQHRAFLDEISKISGVENASACDALPGDIELGGGGTWLALDNNASRTDKILQTDENFVKVLGLELKEGRFFSNQFTTDSLGIVLNEEAVKDFGLQHPIGARLISKEPFLDSHDGKEHNIFTVVGVVKDFHFQSLHKKIVPLVMINANKFGGSTIAVSIKGDHFKTTINAIEKTWKSFGSTNEFNFNFLDQNIAALYRSEQSQQKIFTIFSMLAIMIACIGLFGLATYSTLQRTKEIGIRKVLGAGSNNIVFILSKDFLKLVIIATCIAFPIAWWAMKSWLKNFSYRVNISWWIFLVAGMIAAGIAFITISFQTIKAATANPVKSLRME